jgi:pSer/pThr/pTyr-binding forkhead associated (FHA) protein
MLICPECNSNQMIGSLFCSECGINVLAYDDRSTGRLPVSNILSVHTAPVKPGKVGIVEANRILVIIPSSGRAVTMAVKEEVQIGRADPGHSYFPELDLTQEKGIDHGVSRQHASIQKTNRGVMLIDRGSTNGTLLNKHRLIPDMLYPVQDGDEIRFGKLLVQIYFES